MIVDHLASPAVAGFSVSKIRGQGPASEVSWTAVVAPVAFLAQDGAMLTGEPPSDATSQPARVVRESRAWVKDTGQRVVVLSPRRRRKGLPGLCRLPAGHVRVPARPHGRREGLRNRRGIRGEVVEQAARAWPICSKIEPEFS